MPVDGVGDVLTLDDPTVGSGEWVRSSVDPESGFAAVSCPAPELCVVAAAGSSGDVLTSTNPTGGGGAWSAAHVGEGSLEPRPQPGFGGRRGGGALYGRASARAAAAGTVQIAIRPRSPYLLVAGLKVRVAITYLPRDGGRLTKRKTLPIG